MEEGWYAIGRMVDEPLLHGSYAVAQHIGIHRSLTGILREVTDAVWYPFTASGGVQFSLFVEEGIHIGTS